jgi:uncharacterized membrane protein
LATNLAEIARPARRERSIQCLASLLERAIPKAAARRATYSDAVCAVITTVMVLELRAPDQPAFSALWPLWPTAISYAVSYLFIAII